MSEKATLLGFALISLLSGCGDLCSNEVVARAPSPDGVHDAVLFQRDCGATTGFSTQVSVLAAGAVPQGGGNAFVADAPRADIRTGDWGGPWTQVKWISPDRLSIRYAAGARIFDDNDAVSGVSIEYAKAP